MASRAVTLNRTLLLVEDVCFQWPGSQGFRLRPPNLSLARGASLFLHGPSGCGKSTLLNLIGGVMLAQSGRIELLGRSLAGMSSAARDAYRAHHVGFIFQQFNLIPYLSVLENVLLPCRFSAARAQRAGQPASAAREWLSRLDIATRLHGQPAFRLSVGQQQRVAAARALIGQPDLIIADEPTSALDAERQSAFVSLLLDAARTNDSGVVFVSHDLRLARHFDTTLALAP